MLSTLVFGAFVQTSLAAKRADEFEPTKEPTEEPTFEDGTTAISLEAAAPAVLPEVPLDQGYVFGTPDHDSCPDNYLPITHVTECKNAATILGKGWLRSDGIGVCTFIENSQHGNDNNKMYYGPTGSSVNKRADHHTFLCKRADCGEIE